MRAGILNEIVTIKRAAIAKNDYGEDIEVWNEVTTTRANVRQTASNRTTENQEIVFDYSKEFIMRVYVDVQPYDIIVWKSTNYRVISINKSRELQQINVIGELINE